jgi:hypothetical protein
MAVRPQHLDKDTLNAVRHDLMSDAAFARALNYRRPDPIPGNSPDGATLPQLPHGEADAA